MKKRLLSLALSLALCMGLAVPALAEEETGGAGGDSETTVPVESVTLSGDGLENGTLETGTGVYFTLTATVMPENATDKTVIWTSGDDEIATVEDGIVTGLSVGETTVTATAGGKSATCTVKVTEEFGTDAGEKVTITFQNEGGATIYFGDSSEGSSESVVQIEIDKGGEFHFALDAPEGKKIDSVSVEGGDTLTAESIYYDLENITTDTTIIITLADDPSDTTKKTPTVSGNTVSVLVGSNARIVVETDGTVDAYILGNTSTAPVTQDGVAAVSVSGNIVAVAGIGAGTTHVYINTTETETYSAGYFPITVTVTAPPTNPGGGFQHQYYDHQKPGWKHHHQNRKQTHWYGDRDHDSPGRLQNCGGDQKGWLQDYHHGERQRHAVHHSGQRVRQDRGMGDSSRRRRNQRFRCGCGNPHAGGCRGLEHQLSTPYHRDHPEYQPCTGRSSRPQCHHYHRSHCCPRRRHRAGYQIVLDYR